MIALQPSSPIIVRIVEPKSTGWGEVLFSALGLTVIIVLLAILVGAGLAGVMFWIRSRSS
jgi:hypothetical protein